VKYVDEYNDAQAAARLCAAIRSVVKRPWTLMEICGGQTHSILKSGLEDLLPPAITLVHGPGCPVCVTPVGLIDRAVEIARVPGVTFCSFGDMLRVPGSAGSLLDAKAAGADVRIVYSPLDAVALAKANPAQQVVFFAVGFETTAPANAMAVRTAERERVENFAILVAHVRVPPAIEAILSASDCRVNAFLGPGHVCTVMGYEEYEPIAARYHVPIVVTGFEPVDLLEGIYMAVCQLEERRATVENQYTRSVQRSGNRDAQDCVAEVFQVVRRQWRGIGEIADSGLALRAPYRRFDAEERFALGTQSAAEAPECIAGFVLRGVCKPIECPAFRTRCTPERPLGAPMVSSEGACAAYYRYARPDLSSAHAR
jgi:hydrogenase expression/formation protein HypD